MTYRSFITTLAIFMVLLLVGVMAWQSESISAGGQGLAAVKAAFGLGKDRAELYKILSDVYPNSSLQARDLILNYLELDDDQTSDVVVKLSNQTVCGSAGCPHELFIRAEPGWRRIPFGFSGQELKPLSSRTNGYLDLELNGLEFNWDGARYVPSEL